MRSRVKYALLYFLIVVYLTNLVESYIVTLQNMQGLSEHNIYNNNFYLCGNLAIAQVSTEIQDENSAYFALLKFNEDYTSVEFITQTLINFKYPAQGIVQSDGKTNCYLYFMSIENSQLFAHSLSFKDLVLMSSQQPVKAGNSQDQTQMYLLQQDSDDIDKLQMRRLFFVANSNIYFIDSAASASFKGGIVDNLSTTKIIKQVSRSILLVEEQDASADQSLFVFKLNDDGTLITWKLNLILTERIYGQIDTILKADIVDFENFQVNWPNKSFTLSVYASATYWILLVKVDYVSVQYKLPTEYSIGKGYLNPPNSPKSLNYLTQSFPDGENISTILAPYYLLIQSNQIQKIQTYSLFVSATKFQIYLQSFLTSASKMESADDGLVMLSIFDSDGSLIQFSETDQTTSCCFGSSCVDYQGICCYYPVFLSFEQSENRVTQVICQSDSYSKSELFAQTLVMTSRNLPSGAYDIYVYLTVAVSILIMIVFSVSLLWRWRRINKVARQFLELEELSRKFELTKDQFMSKFEILDNEVLGKGTFGVVKLCLQKPSRIAKLYDSSLKDQQRAIKIINFQVNGQIVDQAKGSELDEAVILIQLQKYRNAIRLVNFFSDGKSIYIVQELAKSNLDAFIIERLNVKKPFSNKEIVDFCIQIGFLITNLHNNEAIAHRDLKPQNILVLDNGEFRLSDFGAAKIFRIQNFYVQRTSIGSLNWMSPEMLKSCFEELDPNVQYEMNYYKCDVFSFGLILLKMVTLQDIRGANKDENYKNSLLNRIHTQKPNLSPTIAKLLEGMLEFDPKIRIDMSEFKKAIMKAFFKKDISTSQIEKRGAFSSLIGFDSSQEMSNSFMNDLGKSQELKKNN